MGDMADWDVDQGIASEIEEPWLAEEQEAEERRLAKRCRHRKRADQLPRRGSKSTTQKRKPTA